MDRVIATGSSADPRDAEVDEEDDQDSVDEAGGMRFVNEWLTAASDSVIGLLLTQMVQIKILSPSGRAQLLVDLNYMRYLKHFHCINKALYYKFMYFIYSTVVSALGLAPHPILNHLTKLLRSDVLVLTSLAESVPGAFIFLYYFNLIFYCDDVNFIQ